MKSVQLIAEGLILFDEILSPNDTKDLNKFLKK